MAYIGLVPTQQVLSTSTQRISANGTDFEYALEKAVSKAADLRVFVGNVGQVPEIDYTAIGTTLIFTSQPPAGTNNITVNYQAGALTTLNLTTTAFPSGTTSAPSIRFTEAAATGLHFPATTQVGLSVSGNTRLLVTDSPTATSTGTGAVRVTGGVGISEALYVGGATRLTATTVSESSTTGALVVSGGVGIAGELNVAGGLTVSGDFTVAGAFTTTASDSLTLNDPFLFLANANPGDAVDTGVISSYTSDTIRYTGMFRDITDGRYKLFDNLTAQPTTTVDTGNVSFQYADFWCGNANVTSTVASTTSLTGALTVWGGIGARGAIYVNSINNAVAIGNGGTNGTGNIGASGAGFNTAFVKSTSAQYADVAEKYSADNFYEPGTVLHFGGVAEVSLCNIDHCTRVAGVVSTNPAYLMNSALEGAHSVTVALLGRVPCKVTGKIAKGDMLVSAGNGMARAEANPRIGAVIGKSLEDFEGSWGVIEVVVGRI